MMKFKFVNIENIYNEALLDSNTTLSICYMIKQVEMYLNTLKSIGYTFLDYKNYRIIFLILMDFGQRETIKRGGIWFQLHSTTDTIYWSKNITIFKISKS